MWMARASEVETIRALDFAGALDEGLAHLDEIAAEYEKAIGLSPAEIKAYLTENIAFRMDEEMKKGLELYFELARKHRLIERAKPTNFIQ